MRTCTDLRRGVSLGDQENGYVVDAGMGCIPVEPVTATGKGASSPARCSHWGAAASETDGSVAVTLEAGGRTAREGAVVMVKGRHREERKDTPGFEVWPRVVTGLFDEDD
jgi:hypothetical protein